MISVTETHTFSPSLLFLSSRDSHTNFPSAFCAGLFSFVIIQMNFCIGFRCARFGHSVIHDLYNSVLYISYIGHLVMKCSSSSISLLGHSLHILSLGSGVVGRIDSILSLCELSLSWVIVFLCSILSM